MGRQSGRRSALSIILNAHSHNTVSLPVRAYYPRLRPEDPAVADIRQDQYFEVARRFPRRGLDARQSLPHCTDTGSPSLTRTPQGTGALVPKTVSLHPAKHTLPLRPISHRDGSGCTQPGHCR